MQQLTPQDAMFVFMEAPNTPMHLGWLNIYDPLTASGGKFDYDAVASHVEKRLHTVRFFRQKIASVPLNMDEPYWIDDEGFELEYHVRHAALPPGADWRRFCTLIARLFAKPLDFSRPLWEMYVIEGLDDLEGFPEGSFALLAKIHHAAVDGISGVDVTTSLHTPEPDTPDPAPSRPWHPETAPRPGELMLRAYNNRLTRPGRLGTVARNLPVFRKVKAAIDAGDLRTPARHKVPKTMFGGRAGPHRVFEARRFTLDELKPLRDLAPGSSLNDVLLALVGGTMRHYLVAKGQLPEDTLVASCPISLRSEEERGTFGNKVGNMNAALWTNLDDPAERLRAIAEETANAKGITAAVGAKTLTEMSQLLPGALMGQGMRVVSRATGMSATNTTVTNVPGPQQSLYLAGARMVTQYTLGTLLEGMGIFHAIQSYCGQLTLAVIANSDKLPDPALYGECIDRAFAELRDAADGKSSRDTSKPKSASRKRAAAEG